MSQQPIAFSGFPLGCTQLVGSSCLHMPVAVWWEQLWLQEQVCLNEEMEWEATQELPLRPRFAALSTVTVIAISALCISLQTLTSVGSTSPGGSSAAPRGPHLVALNLELCSKIRTGLRLINACRQWAAGPCELMSALFASEGSHGCFKGLRRMEEGIPWRTHLTGFNQSF